MSLPKCPIELSIEATPVVPHDMLHADDRNLAGNWPIVIDLELPRELWADAALDVFHSSIPVKELDHFSFVVVIDETLEEIEPDPEHESYSLQHTGRMAV